MIYRQGSPELGRLPALPLPGFANLLTAQPGLCWPLPFPVLRAGRPGQGGAGAFALCSQILEWDGPWAYRAAPAFGR